MFFLEKFSELQLDIIGIVAILGEASVVKTCQISALSWHHVFPRLMPAPQALLKHELERRLPTQDGVVAGVYNGKVRNELNFFCQLLHERELEHFEVELVEIARSHKDGEAYEVNHWGPLFMLSLLGSSIAAVLIGLSIRYNDGWALIATIILSFTSSLVGLASRWELKLHSDKPNEGRKQVIPDGDVVIYYPNTGAFRIIRCNENISRLYFNPELAEPLLSENMYRLMALAGTITLIGGLISLGNSQPILQLSFAAAYVLLNVAYWLASAIHVHRHWKHCYTTTVKQVEPPNPGDVLAPSRKVASRTSTDSFQRPRLTRLVSRRKPLGDVEAGVKFAEAPPRTMNKRTFSHLSLSRTNTLHPEPRVSLPFRNFTTALWKAIALTGTASWLRHSNIAPHNAVWDEWIRQAEEAIRPEPLPEYHTILKYAVTRQPDGKQSVKIPPWPYQQKLNELFAQESDGTKRRPDFPYVIPLRLVLHLKQLGREAKQRVRARARSRLETIPERNGRSSSQDAFWGYHSSVEKLVARRRMSGNPVY